MGLFVIVDVLTKYTGTETILKISLHQRTPKNIKPLKISGFMRKFTSKNSL